MKVEKYQIAKKDTWDGFVTGAKNGHFMHMRSYMDYHNQRFIDHSLFIFEDSGEVLAILPANEQGAVLWSHQGLSFGSFITNADMRMAKMISVFDAVIAYARDKNFSKIIYKAMPNIYHQIAASEDIYALFLKGGELFRVDVSTTIDNSNQLPFSDLRKRGARKAEKHGIEVRISDDILAFYNIINSIVRGKYDCTLTHSFDEIAFLKSKFPDNIKLHAAFLDNEMIAGVLIYETKTVAHAQYIGANLVGKETGALDLLFSKLIQFEYRHKKYFDFGISTEQDGYRLNEKLIFQKEGFGGRSTINEFYALLL